MSLSIGKKSREQELREANLALQGRSVKDEVKDVVTADMTTVVAQPAQPQTEEEAYIERVLTSQIEEGMHLMADEAREALALNPHDESAKFQLLNYQQWLRTKNRPNALTISKKRKTPSGKIYGVWKRTKDYGWLIKASAGAVVSDVIEVKKKGGDVVLMTLTEEVAPGYFKGREA